MPNTLGLTHTWLDTWLLRFRPGDEVLTGLSGALPAAMQPSTRRPLNWPYRSCSAARSTLSSAASALLR